MSFSLFRPSSINLFLCLVLFLFLVLFFLANFEGLLFVSVLSVRLFLRLSSWSFYCCRHSVGFLSLRLFLSWDFCVSFFYPGPSVLSGTVHFTTLYGFFVCSECCFYSLLVRLLRQSSSTEWFCSFYRFLSLLSSHGFFPDVGDMCHSMWQGGFTRNRKQVVNRLKIPQGLSTLLFHRWSEVPSRGGVRGDSP